MQLSVVAHAGLHDSLVNSLTSVKTMSFRSLDGKLMWIVGDGVLDVPQ